MSIDSILRKDDLPEPKRSVEGEPHHEQKDHLLLGFDGQCKKAEELGTRILSIMQVWLIKKHTSVVLLCHIRFQYISLPTPVLLVVVIIDELLILLEQVQNATPYGKCAIHVASKVYSTGPEEGAVDWIKHRCQCVKASFRRDLQPDLRT